MERTRFFAVIALILFIVSIVMFYISAFAAAPMATMTGQGNPILIIVTFVIAISCMIGVIIIGYGIKYAKGDY